MTVQAWDKDEAEGVAWEQLGKDDWVIAVDHIPTCPHCGSDQLKTTRVSTPDDEVFTVECLQCECQIDPTDRW